MSIKGNMCILSPEQRKNFRKQFVHDSVIMKFNKITFYDEKVEDAKTYNNCLIQRVDPFYRLFEVDDKEKITFDHLQKYNFFNIINNYTINDSSPNVIGEICFLDKSQRENFKSLFKEKEQKIAFESIKIMENNKIFEYKYCTILIVDKAYDYFLVTNEPTTGNYDIINDTIIGSFNLKNSIDEYTKVFILEYKISQLSDEKFAAENVKEFKNFRVKEFATQVYDMKRIIHAAKEKINTDGKRKSKRRRSSKRKSKKRRSSKRKSKKRRSSKRKYH
jgi:hypothetical protein